MDNIRYCVEIGEKRIYDCCQSYTFKQIEIGTESELENLKGIIDSVEGKFKARIIDFKTMGIVYKNYNSLVY